MSVSTPAIHKTIEKKSRNKKNSIFPNARFEATMKEIRDALIAHRDRLSPEDQVVFDESHYTLTADDFRVGLNWTCERCGQLGSFCGCGSDFRLPRFAVLLPRHSGPWDHMKQTVVFNSKDNGSWGLLRDRVRYGGECVVCGLRVQNAGDDLCGDRCAEIHARLEQGRRRRKCSTCRKTLGANIGVLNDRYRFCDRECMEKWTHQK
jgi:predicted nucleic acid-binding Zn ribbon protein